MARRCSVTAAAETGDDADEATRFFANEVTADEIIPVAPLEGDFEPAAAADSRIPADPDEVQFKRAGEETGTSKKLKKEPAPPQSRRRSPGTQSRRGPGRAAQTSSPPRRPTRRPRRRRRRCQAGSDRGRRRRIAGRRRRRLGDVRAGRLKTQMAPTNAAAPGAYVPQQVTNLDVAELASAASTFANDARTAGAPATAVNDLVAAGDKLTAQSAQLQRLSANPAQAAAAKAQADEMKRTATAANIEFANALLRDAEARANRVSADVRWAMGSGARTAEQRSVASRLSGSLADLRAAVATAAQATDPVQSLNAARNALASSQTFVSAIPIGVPGGCRPSPHSGSPAAQAAEGKYRRHDQDPDHQDGGNADHEDAPEVVSTGGSVIGQAGAVECDHRGRPRDGSAGDAQS